MFQALSFEEEFLLGLWNFVKSLGTQCGLRDLVGLLENTRDFKSHPIFDVLYILASLVLYLVTWVWFLSRFSSVFIHLYFSELGFWMKTSFTKSKKFSKSLTIELSPTFSIISFIKSFRESLLVIWVKFNINQVFGIIEIFSFFTILDLKSLDTNPFFNVFHQLLVSLYVKDSRKPFTEHHDEFWIIKYAIFKIKFYSVSLN